MKSTKAPILGKTRPLAVHLFQLMLFVLLPCLVFSIILIVRNDNARRNLTYSRAEAAVSNVSDAFAQETTRMRYLLQVLSTKGALLSNNFEALHRDAREALVGSNTHFIVLNENFDQVLNTRVDFGTPLGPGSSQESSLKARQSGQVEISSLFFGRTSGEIVFNMAYYLERENDTSLNLVLTQNARDLVKSVNTQMGEGWNYAILDPDNQYAAGSVSLQPGETFPFERNWLMRNVSGEGRIISHEQGKFLMASSQLTEEGWMAVVWAPSELVNAPLQRTWLLVVLAGTLLLLISIGAAAGGAIILSRPIRRLASNAHAMGEGRPIAPQHCGIVEIDLVSRELATAAEERRRREDEINFLLREVSHRAKNQLTVVSAIARQSLSGAGVDADTLKALLERINALSVSLDRMVGRHVQAAGLKELVEVQLASFISQNRRHIKITGPDIEIRSEAAQAIGLALHELATNATKYGALSVDTGYVNVSWARQAGAGDSQETDAHLIMKWRETGGPPAHPPSREGFGTRIIEDYFAAALSAVVEREFRKEGLYCTFRIPMDTLKPQSKTFGDEGGAQRGSSSTDQD